MERSEKLVVSLSGNNPGFFVSLRVLLTKRQLSKYLLGCTRMNIYKRNALISVFRPNFRRSLESGLLARTPFPEQRLVIESISFRDLIQISDEHPRPFHMGWKGYLLVIDYLRLA